MKSALELAISIKQINIASARALRSGRPCFSPQIRCFPSFNPNTTTSTMIFKSVLPFVAVASAAAVAHVDGRQTCNEASEAELMAAKEAFVNEMVDPDVIQNFEPKGTLDVSYPEGSVTLGNKFNLLGKFNVMNIIVLPALTDVQNRDHPCPRLFVQRHTRPRPRRDEIHPDYGRP